MSAGDIRRQRGERASSSSSSRGLRQRAIAPGARLELERTFLEGQLVYSTNVSMLGQNWGVLVDTGSSELWLASRACHSTSCRNAAGYTTKLIDPAAATDTGEGFSINYVAASASGPVFKTSLGIAGWTTPSQAFGAADTVAGEPLAELGVSGVLGLSLPANSVIQDTISGGGTLNPNNTFVLSSETGSVLPGLWYNATAGLRYFGLGLQRLPSDGGNGISTLTFGGVDNAYVYDANNIQYTAAVPDFDNVVRKWKTYLTDLAVTVNGTQAKIPLSVTGSSGLPTVILDSGAPYNYGNVDLLNALYGAWNVGPAADGSGVYYVDCTLFMQVNVQLAGKSVTMHPLDTNLRVTSDPAATAPANGCVGAFQALPSSASQSPPADLILGAPFLRSIYSTYSCDGVLNSAAPPNASAGPCNRPQIGIYPLINSSAAFAQASTEFNQVRVQRRSLGDNANLGEHSAPRTASGLGSGGKIAIGVVCGLVGLGLMMGLLVFILKRRRAKIDARELAALEQKEADDADDDELARLAKLSEKEKAQARELALLQGNFAVYDALAAEEANGSAAARGATTGPPPGQEWDVSSSGYWEARAIKNQYLKKVASRPEGQQEPPLSSVSEGSGTFGGSRSNASGGGKSEEIEMGEQGQARPGE